MNYETIKQLAKENGLRVKDLTALAPNNDPFYVGRPSDVEQAEWFYQIWNEAGYSKGVHIRRIHYRLVSRGTPRPDGDVYQNDDRNWAYLNNAAKNARYLGYVDFDAFVDNRNPDPILCTTWLNPDDFDYVDPTPSADIVPAYKEWEIDFYEAPTIPAWPKPFYALPYLPYFMAYGYTGRQQDYHIELWCEKSTMNDILIPLCERYGANLVTGLGEMSITAAHELMGRVQQAGRPGRILYISDYDPAGHGMPVSVSRKIEYFIETRYPDLDVKLYDVCLTAEQVDDYNLPRVPSKATDKRKARWDTIHGQGAVELDALEALHPGELGNILSEWMLRWYDIGLLDRCDDAYNEYKEQLDALRDATLRDNGYTVEQVRMANEYTQLKDEWAALGQEYIALIAPLAEKSNDIAKRIDQVVVKHKELCAQAEAELSDALEYTGVYTPPIPDPDLPPEDEALYQSDRSYYQQLAVYKSHRNMTSQEALL